MAYASPIRFGGRTSFLVRKLPDCGPERAVGPESARLRSLFRVPRQFPAGARWVVAQGWDASPAGAGRVMLAAAEVSAPDSVGFARIRNAAARRRLSSVVSSDPG